MSDKPTRPMTTGEVSAYLRYSSQTVKRMARDGQLPGRKVGKEWRFPADQIIALTHGPVKK